MTIQSNAFTFTIQPIVLLEQLNRIGQLATTSAGKMAEIHSNALQRYLDMSSQRLLKLIEIRDAQSLNDYMHDHMEMLSHFSRDALEDAFKLSDLSLQLHSHMTRTIAKSLNTPLYDEAMEGKSQSKTTTGKGNSQEPHKAQAAA